MVQVYYGLPEANWNHRQIGDKPIQISTPPSGLMKMFKSIGDKMEPCKIPLARGQRAEKQPPSIAFWDLSSR